MKTKLLFLSSLLLILNTAYVQDSKKALFLGNSYTYYNNLPVLIESLATANGDLFVHDKNTPGGHTLQAHSTNAVSLNKIKVENWDFVILQGQSQRPSFPPAQVAVDVKPYASILNDSIKANNACTKTLFFMTWGRENGDASNCSSYTPLCTYEGMQQRLRESYLEMTVENNSDCSPVGVAWKTVRELYPSISLYTSDESHPNINGSYLAACVFYSSIYYKSTVGNSFWSSIDSITAYRLQTVASNTVLDSLDIWSIEPMATNFTISDSLISICDSVEISGIWYYANTTISDTNIIVGSCADVVNYTIEIGNTVIDSSIIACNSFELNGVWYLSDTAFSDTVVSTCTIIYNYTIHISPTVEIESFNQVMLLKTDETGFYFNITATNFDTITIYNNDTIVFQFTDLSNSPSVYYCKNNSNDGIEFILEAKNSCSIDSFTRTFVCGGFSSVNELDNSNWQISPNPANNFIDISSNKYLDYSLELFNISGKKLIKRQYSFKNKLQIDISIIDKGIYFLRIYDESNNVIGNRKIIKL